MNTVLSVIIPVLNEMEALTRLLPSLVIERDVEIIVVDGGSTDGTCLVAGIHPTVILVKAKQGRGIQLNSGAKIANSEKLWFLHADSVIEAGWKESILKTLDESNVVAGCFRLRFDYDHWLLNLFGYLGRWNHPLVTYGDQGYFMRKSVFRLVGGFQSYPILEDLEIQCRLRKLGRWRKLSLSITTSARRFRAMGILRQQLKNIAIVSLYLAGASPHWLSRFYLPQFQLKPADQSPSLKPTALNESLSRKGRLTKLPVSLKS